MLHEAVVLVDKEGNSSEISWNSYGKGNISQYQSALVLTRIKYLLE